MAQKSIDEISIEECKSVLEEFFRKECVSVSGNRARAGIEYEIANHLLSNNYEKWVDDTSMAPQLGYIVERALMDFAENRKIFDGHNGKFQIISYKRNGVRNFEARELIYKEIPYKTLERKIGWNCN